MTVAIMVDSMLEQEAQAVFSKLGMTVSDAVSDFLQRAVREQENYPDISGDTERMQALERLGNAWMEIQKYYPEGLDPEKELMEAMAERYGHIG